ncbi:MAG: hypothetical protein KA103_02240 [Saprospiraceae bacterium]|nr:hypothetical protein [Saprospiraceae bacterium]
MKQFPSFFKSGIFATQLLATHRHTDTQTHRHTDTQTHQFAAKLSPHLFAMLLFFNGSCASWSS